MINSDPNGRGDVEEVLVTNFKNDWKYPWKKYLF
jgi:hypothetical protein